MKNRMRELRTCGSVRGEGREVLTYSDRRLQGLDSPYPPWRELRPINITCRGRRVLAATSEFPAYECS